MLRNFISSTDTRSIEMRRTVWVKLNCLEKGLAEQLDLRLTFRVEIQPAV